MRAEVRSGTYAAPVFIGFYRYRVAARTRGEPSREGHWRLQGRLQAAESRAGATRACLVAICLLPVCLLAGYSVVGQGRSEKVNPSLRPMGKLLDTDTLWGSCLPW